MNDDYKGKVVNILGRKKKSDENEPIKYFAGFDYVKLTRDNNGCVFNEEQLTDYAQTCHYIIRAMRKVNGEVCLYNYDVSNNDLLKFMKAFENNTISGTIIEIEKFFPDDLA